MDPVTSVQSSGQQNYALPVEDSQKPIPSAIEALSSTSSEGVDLGSKSITLQEGGTIPQGVFNNNLNRRRKEVKDLVEKTEMPPDLEKIFRSGSEADFDEWNRNSEVSDVHMRLGFTLTIIENNFALFKKLLPLGKLHPQHKEILCKAAYGQKQVDMLKELVMRWPDDFPHSILKASIILLAKEGHFQDLLKAIEDKCILLVPDLVIQHAALEGNLALVEQVKDKALLEFRGNALALAAGKGHLKVVSTLLNSTLEKKVDSIVQEILPTFQDLINQSKQSQLGELVFTSVKLGAKTGLLMGTACSLAVRGTEEDLEIPQPYIESAVKAAVIGGHLIVLQELLKKPDKKGILTAVEELVLVMEYFIKPPIEDLEEAIKSFGALRHRNMFFSIYNMFKREQLEEFSEGFRARLLIEAAKKGWRDIFTEVLNVGCSEEVQLEALEAAASEGRIDIAKVLFYKISEESQAKALQNAFAKKDEKAWKTLSQIYSKNGLKTAAV